MGRKFMERQIDGTKVCKLCKKELDISKFNINDRKKDYNATCIRCFNLMKCYGINSREYEQLLKSQNYCCAICGTKENSIDKRHNEIISMAVDHNHKTGEIRGILCGKCNKAIGLLNDDSELVLKASEYLKSK